ncbi:hypothetical protein [Dysgonomonas sp. GY617]|uniref:hypothetical protein n=1 Tax=Dysgonomonas sp. GY617 TaxID=2780420 RepID=UPI001883A167|nr:hypothetical protein [Dysgonomonas sp. GY617]MBF0576615.1 hypothetical protein [Dysgonomonas sp. GY617]
MRKILTLFLCLSVLGLYSCSSDDDNDNNGGGTGLTVKARVLYETADAVGVTHPDAGAKVYLHYDFDFKNANGYTYQGNGNYAKGTTSITIIEPAQTATIDKDGNVVIDQKFKDRKLTIVIESKYYQGKYTELYYPMFNENIILSNIFRP